MLKIERNVELQKFNTFKMAAKAEFYRALAKDASNLSQLSQSGTLDKQIRDDLKIRPNTPVNIKIPPMTITTTSPTMTQMSIFELPPDGGPGLCMPVSLSGATPWTPTSAR